MISQPWTKVFPIISAPLPVYVTFLSYNFAAGAKTDIGFLE